MSLALAPAHAAAAAEIFDANPDVRAVAFWSDKFGTTSTWPQATVDNRPSRVFRRLEFVLGLTVDDVYDLEVIHRP